jgi:hypothetical protein
MVKKSILFLLLVLLVAGCGGIGEEPAPAGPVVVTPAAPVAPAVVTPEGTAPEAATPEGAAPGEPAAPAMTDAPGIEAPPPAEAEPVSPEMQSPAWLAEPETYYDERVGFTLQYPAGWDVIGLEQELPQAVTGYSVTFTSWPRREAGAGGIPAGGTKFDLTVIQMNTNDLTVVVAERRQTLGDSVVGEMEVVLHSGLPAVRLQTGEDSSELVTVINGYAVVISGIGDQALVEEIAGTLTEIG